MARQRSSTWLLALLLALATVCQAREDPVRWTLTPAPNASRIAPGSDAVLILQASIAPGWHLYSPTTPPGGPNPTLIQLVSNSAIAGYKLYEPAPVRKLDPNFNLPTETYSGQAAFWIKVHTAASASGLVPVSVSVRYQACSDVKCLPPVRKTAQTELHFDPGAPQVAATIPAGYVSLPGAAAMAPPLSAAPVAPPTGATSQPAAVPTSSQGLFPFLLAAFGFGLAALFTPCVFPMIPITVSFFLNRGAETTAGSNKRSWMQALVFCLGIIVLFSGLGLIVTAAVGPFGLLTRLNRASQAGGYVGALLMGLTFSLTSFACIGPIVGPLLAASVQSKGIQPVLGMIAFSAGLAAPFFFLALFPSYLNKLPRSGEWMARVKIVLGFIVLAVMLKYLSNVDQVLQLHWLTRERFLAAWIVLVALPGLYLLGFVPMEGVQPEQRIGVARALIASLFLIFSLSLLPGLFGARLGDLEAYVPEPNAALFAQPAAGAPAATATYFKNQLDAALAAARAQNKLVLVDFTGYACTNCHWMKANMFTRPEIQAALQHLIVVDLYTDGTDAASEANQKFEEQKFGTISIPFYALMDPDGNVVATFPQLTRNTQEFLAFLETRPGKTPNSTAMLR